MPNPSNLYAEKIFGEHPIALWALDDQVDYISIIDEQDRDISSWTITGASAESVTDVIGEPFPNSVTTKILGDLSADPVATATFISSDIINFTSLNSDLGTFSIGTYVYADSSYISGYDIGYQYYDTVGGSTVQILKHFDTNISGRWTFLSETFEIPSENTTFKIVIKINYVGGAPVTSDYMFLINGLTLGQWSEEFNSTSLGTSTASLPSTINLPSSQVIEAKAYGLLEAPGYYFSKNNAILAKNSGMPMVYGASNVTILSPNPNEPSLIIPGFGFLNNLGRYKDYTAEFWIRADSNAVDPKRIFGPIASEDGLYVDGSFLRLKIDKNVSSHFIGEWFRPMLIHIRVSSTSASLLINGEEVISMKIDMANISLPNEYSVSNKNNDWLAFYAYDDISPVEIDCVAIYPYFVSSILAKKRWIYGQAVEFPENINTAYSGKSIFMDYQFSDYSNNYSYPDIGSWNQGVVENLSIENGILSTPKYELPLIIFNNKSLDSWYEDCSLVQSEINPLIKLRPNSSWDNTNGYILFNNINLLSQSTKAIYAGFKTLQHYEEKQELLRFENDTTGNYLSIYIEDSTIKYALTSDNLTEIIYTTYGNNVGDIFYIGLDINKISQFYGGKVASFFGNRAQIKLYVGGNKNFNNTFIGNIYSVGFCTERNLSKISNLFSEKGFLNDYEDVFNSYGLEIADAGYYDTEFWQYVWDGGTPSSFILTRLDTHTASYKFIPKIYFESFILDIAVDSYWEDYLPLTYFAKNVRNQDGDQIYDVDFIQFNINYPAPSIFSQQESVSSWTYSELQNDFANPTQKAYELLDNELYTGYQDYTDLQNKSGKSYSYDTSKSIVRSFISFQYVANGANISQLNFANIQLAPKNGVIAPGDEWINTVYEVVDNMIIYPPSGVDFNELAIVTHLDFKVDGIKTNPVYIKKMQYASESFDHVSANPVGTRFGTKIYPYKQSGIYLDYKSRNPFSIYKGTSPYLYLTRYSGIKLRGDYDPLSNRGLLVPINETMSSDYKTIAMQLSMRFNEDFFPYSPTQIFEIQSKTAYIKFYMVATHPSGKRAKIYAINANTGKIENGIAFYVNGKIVKDPTITIKEWAMLGISFSNSLNFNNYVGSFRITGPLLVNNISHYQATNLQEVQQVATRAWLRVLSSGSLEFDWAYWDAAYIWNGVLVLASTSYYGVNPSDIYKTYTGTNKIIIDDDRKFTFNSYKYDVLKDVEWQSVTLTAV